MTVCRTLATAAACLLAGCADFRDYFDSQLIASRNGYLARTAWNERGGGLCEGRKHERDFHDGFYEGYLSVASGRGGVAPLVPPSKYWAACYQDADGREIINDWFAGYNEGAFAASQDGVGELSEIPTWISGGCCDEQGRIAVRPEPPGPRKPRRGDPPVRAKLPPPLPKGDKPANSEGADDPARIETPPASEPDAIEKMLLDPDAPKPDAKPNDPSAPRKDAGKQKVKTALRPAGRAKAAESKLDADRWAQRQAPKRETTKQAASTVPPPSATPVAGKGWTKVQKEPPVPLNPFARPKLAGSPPPNYPVAPPLISSPGLKSSATFDQEPPKPAETVGDNDLAPPPPANANVGGRDTTAKADRPAPARPAIETVSYLDDVPMKSSVVRPTVKPPHDWSPPSRSPKAADEWNVGHAPKAIEDGWGTPHDANGTSAAGRNK